ncbi:ABC transporter substrate-binding protein, partial [Candidatus Aerophobetes bacterium]|nr:ABC transporter substrate-binding protein [Candidatus Aerophobetes bacterium]
MAKKRKHFCALLVAVLMVLIIFSCGIVGAEKIRVGYLHTVAVDAQFWLMLNKLKTFEKEDLQVEPIMFTSGIPLMEALAGRSVDVAIMGAVISNFPAQGVGKVFLINSIEFDTAKLFARPETNAKSIADVKGKTVATTKGTTAHVFFYNACKSVGLNSEKDVDIVNMDMASAVAAFIKGAVPYVVT